MLQLVMPCPPQCSRDLPFAVEVGQHHISRQQPHLHASGGVHDFENVSITDTSSDQLLTAVEWIAILGEGRLPALDAEIRGCQASCFPHGEVLGPAVGAAVLRIARSKDLYLIGLL